MTGQFTVCSVGSGGCCAESCESCGDLARSYWQGPVPPIEGFESGFASARCSVCCSCFSTGNCGGDSEGSGLRYVFCSWAASASANLPQVMPSCFLVMLESRDAIADA
jgi:hypothetical protein